MVSMTAIFPAEKSNLRSDECEVSCKTKSEANHVHTVSTEMQAGYHDDFMSQLVAYCLPLDASRHEEAASC